MTQLAFGLDYETPQRQSAPIAATSDPVTSHLAAAEITASGARDRQKRTVLDALRNCSVPRTSRELAERAGLDRYVVARRLPDLERDTLVRRVGMGICSITGRVCVTWAVRA